MRLRVVANLAACAVALVCLSSCREEPMSRIVHPPRADASQPAAIVSLSPSTTDLTQSIGGRLVGRCAADTDPGLKHIPIVCNLKPDYEKIAAVHPDVILFDPDLFSEAEIDKLKPIHSNVIAVGGYTVHQFIGMLYLVGSYTSNESSIQDYITRIYRDMDVSATNPITPKPTAAMILVNPSGNPMVAGKDSFYADLIRQGGAEPVGPPGDKFESISVEALVALNPTILVVPASAEQIRYPNFAPLAKDPRLASLPAAKKGHVFAMDEMVAERRGARVDMAIRDLHSGFVQVMAR